MNKAVIMAGGFGTRLRPLTMNIPKPMVPIGGTPMMEHIVNLLKKHGIKDVVSLLYFQPDIIKNHFGDGADFGINMRYVSAEADYGTAGSVGNARDVLDSRFIIISGDVLTDFDLTEAINFHERKGSKATILLTRVPEPLQYGIVITDQDNKIVRFLEKPSWGQVFSDTINTGIYILEPEVLDMIPHQEDFDFSKDLFPKMLREGMPLYGYISNGYWKDVGNLNEYQNGQNDALKDKVDLQIRGKLTGSGIYSGKNTKISDTAHLKGRNVIGNNVKIGEHVELEDCVIGDNCEIGHGSKLYKTTIWEYSNVGDFAEISNSVVCSNCELGDSISIAENVFISDNCAIEDSARLNSNIKLWPGKHVEEGAILNHSLVQEEKWLRELFTDARISGICNVEMHPEFGAKLGAALGMTFGRNASLIGSRDPDKVSRLMKRSIAAGLASVGCNVNDLQITSIPQTRQELMTQKYSGGFHVRRSPRNRDRTDIIIFNKEGRDISISMTKKIERFFFGEDIKRVHHDNVGKIRYPERTNEIYINRYLESLDTEVIKEHKFKLLMDYSFGLASTIFPSILGKLNCEALSLNDYVDAGRFHPSPSIEAQAFDNTGKIMKSLGYELGFRLEAGAEKISLIDERGVWIPPERLLTIITKLFLETHKDKEPYSIGVSVAGTEDIETIAKDYNVEVIRIENSHGAMMEVARDEKVLFAGGIFGGFVFTNFLFASDGMYSVGMLLEMLAKTDQKISRLDEELPKRHQVMIDVECPWKYKGKVMRRAMEYSENKKRQLIEGVKIFEDGNSVLLLPAKEKSAFLIFAESDKFENAQKLAEDYSKEVKRWILTD